MADVDDDLDVPLDDDELFEALRVGSDEDLVGQESETVTGGQEVLTIPTRREPLIRRQIGVDQRTQYLAKIRPGSPPFAHKNITTTTTSPLSSQLRVKTLGETYSTVPISSRSLTKNVIVRDEIDVEDFTETIDANKTASPDNNLYRLQRAVLEGKQVDDSLVKAVIRSYSLFQDVFVAFYWGLGRKLINPDTVMLESILWALGDSDTYEEDQLDYIKLVALALRYEADPNLYVAATCKECLIKYHLVYFVHDFNYDDIQSWYDNYEEDEVQGFIDLSEGAKNRIIRLLMLYGADTSLGLISIDKETRESISYVNAYKNDPNSRENVFFNLEADVDLEILQTVPVLVPYYEERLQIVGDINSYRGLNNLANLYELDDVLWEPSALAQEFYSLNMEKEAVTITAEEDLVDATASSGSYLSKKTFSSLLNEFPSEEMQGQTGTNLLRVMVQNIYATGFSLLLQRGAKPTYVLKDFIISKERETIATLPLSAAIYADMLILLTRNGYDLDSSQLLSLQRFDQATYRKIMSIRASNPLWKRECAVNDGFVSTSLRRTARGVGLDPSGTKEQLCRELDILASVPAADLVEIAKSRQQTRITAFGTTLPEAVAFVSSQQEEEAEPTPPPPRAFTPSAKRSFTTSLGRPATRTSIVASPTSSPAPNGSETVEIVQTNGNGDENGDGNGEEAVVTTTETETPVAIVTTTTRTLGSPLRSPKAAKAVLAQSKRVVVATPAPTLAEKPSPTSTVVVSPTVLPDRICANEEFMTSDPREANDLDLVVYNDRNDQTWCFLSQDYRSLIEMGINPFTEEKIPPVTMAEIKSKYAQLQKTGVGVQPIPISKGLSRRQKSQANLQTQQVVQTLRDYYLAYGVDPELLASGYTITDMQNILGDIYSPDGETDEEIPQLDNLDRTHALHTFASVLVADVEASEDQDARLNEMFEVIGRVNATEEYAEEEYVIEE